MQNQRMLTFIEKAQKIYRNKYDYSKVIYENARTVVEISCKIHGRFDKTPDNHLRGQGCPKCAYIQKIKNFKKTCLKKKKEKIKTSTFLCDIHGNFISKDNNKCPKCKREKERKIKEENFISKAKLIHGDKYDYSKIIYRKSSEKVIIICPKHGEFEQIVSNHLSGKGCRKCQNEATAKRCRSNNKDFIQKAKLTHGNKYDYSKVVYIKNSLPVAIICPEHGEFEQTPANHLVAQYGCSQCSNIAMLESQSFTSGEFISKAKLTHGNKYDYSKVVYIKNSLPVAIICPEHGEFEQTPANHLSGSNCSKCMGFNKTKDEFVFEANKIHNYKYNYELANYSGTTKKITIICPKHGEFEQMPVGHLSGKGCRKCSFEISAEKNRHSTEDFIQKAKVAHGNRYDYSKSIYQGDKIPLTIICPEHGEFEQIPSNHLQGAVCITCSQSRSKAEIAISEYLIKHRISFTQEATSKKIFENSLFLLGYERTMFDFFIPKKNLLIEFDGEGHFFPVSWGGISKKKAYEKFIESEKRDRIKDQLVIQSKYDLIRIPFWKKNSINEILDEVLSSKNIKNILHKYSHKYNRIQYEMIYELGIKTDKDYENFLVACENDEDL